MKIITFIKWSLKINNVDNNNNNYGCDDMIRHKASWTLRETAPARAIPIESAKDAMPIENSLSSGGTYDKQEKPFRMKNF